MGEQEGVVWQSVQYFHTPRSDYDMINIVYIISLVLSVVW